VDEERRSSSLKCKKLPIFMDEVYGNTDSQFFCSRPQISTKTGSLRFGNKLNKKNGLAKSLVIRTREKWEGRKYLPGLS
jgi:hypothetical protein